MAKFSVKKPFTVLVAVVAILVLGFVAFTGMTPDLLPNIDVPYVVIVTAYPGATPEKVETAVSKPLEQTMSTLEHIENVQSVSSENRSMVILEFAEEVNMDTATVDILQKISQIEDYWEDSVATPYMLKLNPSMLPVMVAALDMEGMDVAELSAFTDEVLLNKLEGVAGVASVSASGLLEQNIQVKLSQEKIDKLNKDIYASIDSEFAENAQELNDAKAEAEDGKAEIESGKAEAKKGEGELADKTSAGEAEIASKQMELVEAKIQIQNQIAELEKQLEQLKESEKSLKELQENITKLTDAQTQLKAGLAQLRTLEETLASLLAAETAIDQQIAAIEANPDMDDAMKQAAIAQITASPEYQQVKGGLTQIAQQLEVPEMPRENLTGAVATQIATVEGQLAEVEKGLEQIDSALAAQGLKRGHVPGAIKDIENGKKKIEEGLVKLKEALAGIENGSVQLTDALAQLSKTKTEATIKLGDATAQLVVGEAMLDQALTQIDDGLEKIEDAKEDAYTQADLKNIVTMENVSGILVAQNFTMPVGYVSQDGEDYLVRVGDTVESIQELEDIVLFDLKMDGVAPIRLADVATVEMADNEEDIYAKVNGNNGVLLSFNKQSAVATAEVSDNLQAKFDELSAEYEGLRFVPLMNQGDYIYLVVNSIVENLLYGALFAIIILFLFLRDLRPTLITLCSIPISVLFAIVLMYFSGVTLNIISLSGLAVAVGMLVDNSVVVIENIYRLRSEGASAARAAVAGAGQVAGAIAASTLTTICVFFPIVFVQGLTRQLFTDMALTLAYSLLASLIVAMTLVPAMSASLLKKSKPKPSPVFDKVMGGYRRSAGWALRHKGIVLLAATAMLVLSIALGFARGFSFMPQMNMAQLTVNVEMPEEATFEETKALSNEVMARIMEMPEVDTVGAMSGGDGIMGMGLMGGGGSGGESVSMYVQLTEEAGTESAAVARKIDGMFTDLDAQVSADSASMDMSALGGSGVTVELYGEDLDTLQEAARQVAGVLEGVEGIAEADDGIGETSPEIRFIVNKDKAMAEGLTVAQVFSQLNEAMTTESTSTSITYDASGGGYGAREGEDYDVLILTGKDETLTPDYIKNYMLTVTDKDGDEKKVHITDIAEIVETETATSINRINQRRTMTVSGTLAEGYNVTQVTSVAEEAMRGETLAAGVSYEFTGENQTIMDAMVELLKMLALGVLLVYLIMVAQFQSLKSPFIVMFTIPLAFTGGLLALAITGLEMSVIAVIGFVMLVGIIVNNGIVLVDYINQLRQGGMERRKAILQAGVTRMRPILMTSLTTILGLITMALGVGMGADLMQPIAIVCIGGLAYATLLTLYVVPCIYDLLNRKERRLVTDEELDTSDISDEAAADLRELDDSLWADHKAEPPSGLGEDAPHEEYPATFEDPGDHNEG